MGSGGKRALVDASAAYVQRGLHDLRNQLSVIGPKVDADGERWKARVEHALRRAKQIIDDLETPPAFLTHKRARMSLKMLIRRYAKELVAEHGPARIRLNDAVGALPVDGCWCRGDIESLLRNLVENALKYSPSGTLIQLSLTVRNLHGHRVARFSVADQGYGIAAEDLTAIFAGGYRSLDGMPAGIPGTGRGLAFCRQIVRCYGGKIWATSPGIGKGSTVTVELDVEPLLSLATRQ